MNTAETTTDINVYVGGKDQNVGTLTLEGALILAIAHNNMGPNPARYMAMGACKLLGIKDAE